MQELCLYLDEERTNATCSHCGRPLQVRDDGDGSSSSTHADESNNNNNNNTLLHSPLNNNYNTSDPTPPPTNTSSNSATPTPTHQALLGGDPHYFGDLTPPQEPPSPQPLSRSGSKERLLDEINSKRKSPFNGGCLVWNF